MIHRMRRVDPVSDVASGGAGTTGEIGDDGSAVMRAMRERAYGVMGGRRRSVD
jgi:hypothetical protein